MKYKGAGDPMSYDDVLALVKTYITKEESLALIQKAYDFIMVKHKVQKRKSGEPYTIHLIWVAYILATLQTGPITIAAGLLHDVMEDCDVPREEMVERFGEEVTTLVEGVTKITKMPYMEESDFHAENHRKIYIAMAKDIRVILIKLADRLHNMRTLQYMSPEKQQRISRETLEVYAPIAHRLGINTIKAELEDLSLFYTKPDVYRDIEEKLNNESTKLNEELELMKNELIDIMNDNNIHFHIKSRVKSVHSIYEKMAKGKKWNEIYDILALRIIVDTVSDCYLTIGLIHAKFRPLPKRFKDYIAMPKENMYQSLHTSIFGPHGYVYEVQIRTTEMDEIAEKGIASHWSYKEHTKGGVANVFEQKLEMFRNLIEQHSDDLSNNELKKEINEEALSKMIYCFTPKGDVVELPANSTPIDFAYRIHSKVGDTCVGAIVNEVMVPLNKSLEDGDIVSIKTSKDATPSKEWLNIVKTSQAKNKIKSYFSKIDREEYIKRGQDLLEKEIRRRKLTISDVLASERVDKVCKDLKLDNLEDIYLSIGSLRFTPSYIINMAYEDKKDVHDILIEKMGRKQENINYKSDIIVAGSGNIKVNIAKCCKPIKGDAIIGYITKGEGITVHKKDCPNILNTNRLIDVSWNDTNDAYYFTDILVSTINNKNYLYDIVSLAKEKDIYIDAVSNKEEDNLTKYKITLKIKNIKELDNLINALNMCSYVIKVERVKN